MSHANTILVICREPRDLPLVDQISRNNVEKIVVASDDAEVHRVAAGKMEVLDVCYIETMESLYSVSDDVLKLREQVNRWLTSLLPNGRPDRDQLPDELLHFEHHAEGGATTQKIQDALLLIRCYETLLSENHVSTLILRRHFKSRWDDDVLVEVAKGRGISLQLQRSIMFRLFEKADPSRLQRQVAGNRVTVYLPLSVIRFAQRLRLYVRVAKAKLGGSNRPKGDEQHGRGTIAFLLGASSEKQVQNIIPVMEELKSRGSYNPVTLCWSAAEGAQKVRSRGIQALEIEKWFPLSALIPGWLAIRKIRSKAKAKLNELLTGDEVSYHGIPVGPLLEPSFDHILGYQLVERYFLLKAAERYFKHNMPAAMKTWGDSILDLGSICRQVSTRDPDNKPLIFDYSLGTGSDWPYARHSSDLYFANDLLDKKLLTRHGADPDSVIITGQARYDHLDEFQMKYNKHDSRVILGVPETSPLLVFYAIGYPVRGLESSREFFTSLRAVLKFFSEGSRGDLIIKPHPSDSANSFAILKRAFPDTNGVHWLDKTMLPYHCIQAADLVLTKMSTVGVEAILMGVPLITIALDGERRFQEPFGDVPDHFETMEELLANLNSLVEDRQRFRDLEHRQGARRQRYLENLKPGIYNSATKAVSDIIEDRLDRT